MIAFATSGQVGSRNFRPNFKEFAQILHILRRIIPPPTGADLWFWAAAFQMQFSQVGILDTQQLCCFTRGEFPQLFPCVRGKQLLTMRLQPF